MQEDKIKQFEAYVGSKIHHKIEAEINTNLPYLPSILDSAGQVNSLANVVLSRKYSSILVKGHAGMGKTSLALNAAQLISQTPSCPFDFIYQSTARAKTWVSLSDILDPFARFLGNEAIPAAPSDDKKLQLLRAELGERKGLIILDNVETVDPSVLDAIYTASDKLTILYTSRTYLETQQMPHLFRIEPLTDIEISSLIHEHAGWEAEPPGLRKSKLVKIIAGNPLAAKWSGGRLRNGIPQSSLEERLQDGEGDLFSKLFSDNWHDLSREAQNALMTTSLLGPTVAHSLLVRAISSPKREAEDALAELHQVSLLEISRPGTEAARTNMHPLARSYATMRHDSISDEEQNEILLKILKALIDFCEERCFLQLGRDAYDELDREIESLLVVAQRIGEEKPVSDMRSRQLLRLNEALSVYLWRRGQWAERAQLSVASAEVAQAIGEGVRAARAYASAGIVRHWQGETKLAKICAEAAMQAIQGAPYRPIDHALITRLNALIDHAEKKSSDALIGMLTVLDAIREADADDYRNQEAIRLFADWPCPGNFGFRAGEVAILQEIGIIYTDLGSREDAEYWLGRSIQLAGKIGDSEGKAIALSHRGRALISHRPKDAEHDFCEALRLAESVGRRSTEGRALLGLALVGRDDQRRRVSYAQRAGLIFTQLGMSKELDTCLNYLAMLKS